MQEKTITQELIDLRTRGRILYALYIVTARCIPAYKTDEILAAAEAISDSKAEVFGRKHEDFLQTQQAMVYEVLDFIQKEATDELKNI